MLPIQSDSNFFTNNKQDKLQTKLNNVESSLYWACEIKMFPDMYMSHNNTIDYGLKNKNH